MAYGDPPICTCHMSMTTHVGAIGPCPTHTPILTDTFRRLLAEHGQPVVIDLPPDLDPATRDALTDVARGSPSVIVVGHGERGPKLHHAIDRGPALDDALARLNTALDHLPAKDPPVLAALPLLALAANAPRMPGERDLFRVPAKAPKPPPEVQTAIMSKAADRNARKRINNLVSIGHSRECATRTVHGWAGDPSDTAGCVRCEGASNV